MKTKKIILDCDPGHDDAVAIMLALASNEIDLLGISCVAGNATLENTTKNTLKICSLINKTQTKVYSGASKPLKHKLITAEHVHGKTGLDIEGKEIEISPNISLESKDAVDFIIDTCIESKDNIYLCPTGPLTNIALALLKNPSIKNKIEKIVFMGGAAMTLGNISPVAEFNIYVDPHAANIVLNSGIPLVMMGLDVTHKICVDDKVIRDIKNNDNKSSNFFADLMNFYSKFHRDLYDTDESPLHDPCVIAYLIDNSIFTGKEVYVQVEEESNLTRGNTVVDWLGVTNNTPNCLVINDANKNKFFSILKERLKLLI